MYIGLRGKYSKFLSDFK